jgi:xanthine/uracil permease
MRATVLVLAAVAWLVVGCCGLLWTIAFTTDPRSMVIGLVVWVFCFVAPSTLATVVACRLDESDETARASHRRTAASAPAGD